MKTQKERREIEIWGEERLSRAKQDREMRKLD